ncbi:MAG: transporter [Planctomycetes bacterium]|nr:transporter [Planctomycetota bacterium]
MADAASLVGLGRVQNEHGYTDFVDRDNGIRVQTHSYPERLLRMGLYREWFEFRLAYNYFRENSDTGGPKTSLHRSDDIYGGAKVALAEQAGLLPEFTIFPQMRTPTGHKNFTSGEVLPRMNFAYAWMVTKQLEIEANTQVNRRADDGADHYTPRFFKQSISSSISVNG